MYWGFRNTGYLPFYFQGYRILSILLPGIWDTVFNISVTFRDIEYLGKLFGDICQLIRDTCLFTSRDMGYLVPPYTSLIIHANQKTMLVTCTHNLSCLYIEC